MVELKDVTIDGSARQLSLMAWEGKLTCLTGGTTWQRRQLLLAILGFVPVASGFISIDGEPLNNHTFSEFRLMTAYVPDQLADVGQINVYRAPTVQQVFALNKNRANPISNGILAEEIKRTGTSGRKAELLAVGRLLERPVLLVDNPSVSSANYLKDIARTGRVVIVTSDEEAFLKASDTTADIE